MTSPHALPLWVETCGAPAGPTTDTFLLVHGYGGSSFSWREWVPELGRRGHVVLVDLKGFGKAPRPADGRYAPADHVALLERLLRERDLRNVTLVGHSMGGGLILLLTLALLDASEDDRLRRLCVVSGAAYRQRLPPFVTLARHPRFAGSLLRILGPRVVVGQALRTMVYDPGTITGSQIRGYAAPLRQPGTLEAFLATALSILPPDLDRISARYPEIGLPTLLLWGRHDPAVPLWVGRRLHEALPASDLYIVERCGHLPPEEAPRESLAALVSFLDRTG